MDDEAAGPLAAKCPAAQHRSGMPAWHDTLRPRQCQPGITLCPHHVRVHDWGYVLEGH